MKTSFIIATLAVVGAGAVGAGATFALQPFIGSDTEYDIQNQALVNSTLGNFNDYSGGGSGGAENAMTASSPKQLIGPMSKMLTTTTCAVALKTHATGIAFGLDAVNVYSASSAGGTVACNGSTDDAGTGLNYNRSIPNAAADGGPAAFPNWTDALALLYGGRDKSTGITDCNSAKRKALVANWSNLFENACSNGNSTCTTASFNSTTLPNGGFHINGQLWHAFRRDDNSGTSDVFASLLGLGNVTATDSGTTYEAASVSSAGNNGFGASPYCNVINWDTTAANKSPNCKLDAGKQFVGPGGVAQGQCTASGNTNFCDVVGAANAFADGTTCTAPGTSDPVSGLCSVCNCAAIDTVHKRPPYLTWGTVADGSVTNPNSGLVNAAAVLPTSYQDNDPIRRPCLGLAGDIADNPGEEVCNRDGTLGLVLPVPPVDFVPKNFGGRDPFPGVANACGGNSAGTNTFDVFSCALTAGPAGRAAGGCPNGDTTFGGGCIAATGLDNVNTLCYAAPTDNQVLGNYTTYDGRIYNLTLTNGTNGYTTFTIPSVPASGVAGTTGLALAFAGHYGRIHSQTVIWDKTAGSTGLANKGSICVQQDATDQLGCLVQADPCSVSYAGDNAKSWGSRATPVVGSNNAALRVNQIASSTGTIRSGAYLLWRKIYLNSSLGFDTVNSLSGADAGVKAQLELAEFESNTTSITTLLSQYGFFSFGPTAPNGTDAPFCEDYNEQMLCAAGSNSNACNLNAGIPVVVPSGANAAAFSAIPSDPSADPNASTKSTVCGNGRIEAFEDCDNGLANGTSGNPCSNTCRFVFP
jgi:hypothetical protein